MVFVNPYNLVVTSENEMNVMRRMADNAMTRAPVAITEFARADIAPRMYYSIGRYYHPNPNTPDGMPWISRDGIANPAADIGPKAAMSDLSRDVLALAVAGFFIDKKYSAHAMARLSKWFLGLGCDMRPDLTHAQFVPGVNMGRPAGIIDSHKWMNIILAMDFLYPVIDNDSFFDGMRNWFGDYVDWLATSPHGVAARKIGNNISAWWAAMIMVFSVFSGRTAHIDAAVDLYKWIINERMDGAGCFAGELRRTRSLHYCRFHLDAMALIADAAECVGVDLWHWRGRGGMGIESAFDFQMPYILGNKRWPYSQIMTEQFPESFAFCWAAHKFTRPEFNAVNTVAARPAGFGDVMGPLYLTNCPTR